MNEQIAQTEERRGVLGWMVRYPKITAALIIFVMLALAVIPLQLGVESELARRMAAIKAKGEPTCVADLIARQRHVPDDENMLVVVARQGKKLAIADLPEDQYQRLRYVGKAKRTPTGERWSGEELDAARWYFDRFAPEIGRIHAGLELKDSAYNVRWAVPPVTTPIPELSDIRQVSRLLAMEILTAANDGDSKKTERLLIEEQPLLNTLQGDLNLIAALVQMAMKALALDAIERSINQVVLDDSFLQATDAWLRETEGCPDMAAAARVERATFMDTHIWLYSTSWRRLIPILPEKDMTDALELQNMFVESAGAAYGELKGRIAAIEAKADSISQYRFTAHTLVPMLIPPYSRAIVLSRRGIGENRALRAAIGAERFRLASGRWPSSLNEIVPKYLDAVPIDPIDGKPIRYALIPEGVKTWTIAGDDHDEDNGGDVRRLEPYDEKIKPKDFGWVILNPELRGRPAPVENTRDKKPSVPSSAESD